MAAAPWGTTGPGIRRLLAGDAVDGLAEQVGVPGVPGGLLQQVQQDPAQRESPAVAERLYRELVQAVRLSRGLAAPLASLPVALAQLLRLHVGAGPELPLGVGVEVDP